MARRAQWPPPRYLKRDKAGKILFQFARVFVGGKAVDYRLGPPGTEAARIAYAQLQAELLATAGTPATSGRITLAEIVVRFMRHAAGYYVDHDGGPGSEVGAFKLSLLPALHLYGDSPAEAFGPLCLKATRELMVHGWTQERSCGRPGGGRESITWEPLCRSVTNQRIRRIKNVFRWAASEELLPAAVHQALCTVRPLARGRTRAHETKPVQDVPDEIVVATLPHLHPVMRDMVQVQRFAGMRPGELVVMRPMDVDRTAFKIDGVPIWVYRPGSDRQHGRHKGTWRGHGKAVPLGPQAQAVLATYLDNREPTAFCFSPGDAMAMLSNVRRQNRRTPVYGSKASKSPAKGKGRKYAARYTADSYGKRVAAVCKRHGIPKWSPNCLRHSSATQAQLTVSEDAARCLLGHKSPTITQVYMHGDLQTAAKFAAKYG
jgi:integrase